MSNTGRVAVVTGANAGVGWETARRLAELGVTVVLGCRDVTKGNTAAEAIAAETGIDRRRLCVVRLDLASLASVREAAEEIKASHSHIDLLVNNAGVMAVPFAVTEDGFERTFATNHLGHFALTGLLVDRLITTPGSRVVTVSSNAHRRDRNPLLAREAEETYDPSGAYDRSKLANLLFAYELQRRFETTGAETISLAAHPGNVRTGLWRTSSRLERALLARPLWPLTFWLAQDARAGAQPTLRAALDPCARGGDYYGPNGWLEFTGRPVLVRSSPSSHDAEAQRQLWLLSEALTGIRYPEARHSTRAAGPPSVALVHSEFCERRA